MSAGTNAWHDFPVHRVHPDRELYRIHRSIHEPLWYATTANPGDGGRFDLPEGSGNGTCYLAVSAVGAFLEKFGRFGVLTQEIVDEHRLAYLAPTTSLDLADLTDRTVLGSFGITGDVSTGTDYVPSQELAVQLRTAGFDGIYYAARHDPAFTERSIAMFGAAGELQDAERKLFEVSTAPIPRQLIHDIEDEFGLRVVPSRPVMDFDFDLPFPQ